VCDNGDRCRRGRRRCAGLVFRAAPVARLGTAPSYKAETPRNLPFPTPTSVRPDLTCEGKGKVIISTTIRPKHDQNLYNYMSDLRNTNKHKFSAAPLVAFGCCEGIMLWMQD
jgi:hypothetical protein